jgi:nucleoside-diphosphate-sugar epimerase
MSRATIFRWRTVTAPIEHLDDAATATVLALEQEATGVYNVVDDDPAPVREWLPVLADALGAQPPRHVPRWLGLLFAGEAAVMMGTEARGPSNAKAKRELGWTLRHPTWREGFRAAYAAADAAPRAQRPMARTGAAVDRRAARAYDQ